ncbi:MAG: pirin family protein, partial [Stenotrophomonas sp.]
PKYQEFAPERIPVAQPAPGVQVKVIAGQVGDTTGPIVQPATDPLYLDIQLDAGAAWDYALPEGHNAFAYVFEGALVIGVGDDARPVDRQEMAVLGGGELLQLRAGDAGARLILVAGRPLREPVMRHGPFVMNTKQELMQAFVDFQEGRF